MSRNFIIIEFSVEIDFIQISAQEYFSTNISYVVFIQHYLVCVVFRFIYDRLKNIANNIAVKFGKHIWQSLWSLVKEEADFH